MQRWRQKNWVRNINTNCKIFKTFYTGHRRHLYNQNAHKHFIYWLTHTEKTVCFVGRRTCSFIYVSVWWSMKVNFPRCARVCVCIYWLSFMPHTASQSCCLNTISQTWDIMSMENTWQAAHHKNTHAPLNETFFNCPFQLITDATNIPPPLKLPSISTQISICKIKIHDLSRSLSSKIV